MLIIFFQSDKVGFFELLAALFTAKAMPGLVHFAT